DEPAGARRRIGETVALGVELDEAVQRGTIGYRVTGDEERAGLLAQHLHHCLDVPRARRSHQRIGRCPWVGIRLRGCAERREGEKDTEDAPSSSRHRSAPPPAPPPPPPPPLRPPPPPPP